jgi:hypothetical protein
MLHRGGIPKIIQKDTGSFFKANILCDKNLLIKTWMENKTICFGAYLDEALMGIISSYVFKDSIIINNFYYKENLDFETKERLLSLLLKNINNENKTIMVLVSEEERILFEKYNFDEFAPFYKAWYSGSGGTTFNSRVDEIASLNHVDNLRKNDKYAFSEDRFFILLQIIMKRVSLSFGVPQMVINIPTPHLAKCVIKIHNMDYENWEHFAIPINFIKRSLMQLEDLKKKIKFYFPPSYEITDLYSSCKFEYVKNYTLMYINKKPTISLDMVYGF